MTTDRRFELDTNRVVHETIDGETIAIDLTTGTYFSLTGSGPVIWQALINGAPEATVRAAIGAVDPEASAALEPFVDELVREGLLEPAGDVPPSPGELDVPGSPLGPPRLERYADMEHLLLLDPIHEVQAAGWPETAPAPPAG